VKRFAFLLLAACGSAPAPSRVARPVEATWTTLARDLCVGLERPGKLPAIAGVSLAASRPEPYDGGDGVIYPVTNRADLLRVLQWTPGGVVREQSLDTTRSVAEVCAELGLPVTGDSMISQCVKRWGRRRLVVSGGSRDSTRIWCEHYRPAHGGRWDH
jgi:hypothetical protein